MTRFGAYISRLNTETGCIDILPATLFVFKSSSNELLDMNVLEMRTSEDGQFDYIFGCGNDYEVLAMIRGDVKYYYFWAHQADVETAKDIFRKYVKELFDSELQWAEEENELLLKLDTVNETESDRKGENQ